VNRSVIAAVLFAAACSGEDATRDATHDGGFADGPAPGFDFDGGRGGSGIVGPPGSTCSPDMRAIIDQEGAIVKECPAGEGCGVLEGTRACVPACEAAKINGGNLGCEFVVATPAFYPDFAPPCFAVFVANAWPAPAKLQIARAGSTFDVTKFGRIPKAGVDPKAWAPVPSSGLPPNEVAVLFLSSDPKSSASNQSGSVSDALTCPITPAIDGPTAVSGTGRGEAFRITTDVPVSAYDILPFGGAKSVLPSAELLYPTTAWGTNYVAIVPPLGKDLLSGFQEGPQWMQIVAQADGTTVKIAPSKPLPVSATVPDSTTFTLKAGEFVQWSPSGEISGSIVQSDKPVAITTGNGYLCLQSSTATQGGGCDSGHQQIQPISALGSDYVLAPYTTRRADLKPESIPYRIVGTVDGTTLSSDPPVAGIPTTIGKGQVVDFEASVAFRLRSQSADHPFQIAQFMTGGLVEGGSRPGITPSANALKPLGDEEFLVVQPPAQWLRRYVFFTDPTYATTNLVLVRAKTPSGFRDVHVDCVGVVGGWKPIGTTGDAEMAEVDLVRGTTARPGCANGPHTAQSDGAFGLVVWGLDRFASYAYPAGGNVTKLTSVEIPVIR
jgi:hypothetical protein